jgi:hypothetical protein
MTSTDNGGRRAATDRRAGDRRKEARSTAMDRRQGDRRSGSDRRAEPR